MRGTLETKKPFNIRFELSFFTDPTLHYPCHKVTPKIAFRIGLIIAEIPAPAPTEPDKILICIQYQHMHVVPSGPRLTFAEAPMAAERIAAIRSRKAAITF